MAKHIPVITIDGPVGVGKGTISQMLAKELGWNLLDSGALYRVLAIAANKHAVALDNAAALELLAEHMDVQFLITNQEHGAQIILEGEDVSEDIRTESCGSWASEIAELPSVRQALLLRQHAFCNLPGLVADGRDMGTVVFPNAQLKFFLTATAKERAVRRHKQLKEKGINVSLTQLAKEIAQRDIRDTQRSVAPLVPAKDAILVDTTTLSVASVFERVIEEVEERLSLA